MFPNIPGDIHSQLMASEGHGWVAAAAWCTGILTPKFTIVAVPQFDVPWRIDL